MSANEYKAALFRAAQISELMTKLMDEELLDLFEAYGNVHESIVRYEQNHPTLLHAK